MRLAVFLLGAFSSFPLQSFILALYFPYATLQGNPKRKGFPLQSGLGLSFASRNYTKSDLILSNPFFYIFDVQTIVMKKLYTLIVVLIGLVGKTQIINIPDANFKAMLLAASTSNQTASNFNYEYFKIDANNNGQIELSEALLVRSLYVYSSNISDITGIESFTNLRIFYCYGNQLTTLNVSGLTNLQNMDCSINQLILLNVSGLTNLQVLNCFGNQLTSLNTSGLINLQYLSCYSNQITSLDFSQSTNFQTLSCANNQLNSLFVKNGKIESTLSFQNNPNLQYICADEQQLNTIQNQITQYGYSNCHVNSYCSFTPGGLFYTIQGNNHYDNNSNGCDLGDIDYPNLKLSILNGSNTSNLIADATGNYHYDLQNGTYVLTPVLENPTYFNVSPTSSSVSFPPSSTPFLQNFCITPNGTHNDLEIAIYPLTSARPGFDANYIIVYKNKGTTTQNGTVSLSFLDLIEDFVSSSPNFTSQSTNTLNWDFSNLLPFETREIRFIFNINSPVETPPVNAGNLINYAATVNGATDETTADNISNITQTITNSLDPNDKTCTEGNNLPVYRVGEYLHYVIRFENSGTANAENIVVKDIIDMTRFDISTLVPLNGSHPFETKISSGNKVEFIFRNITLPFDDANNDGYVAFKIKTLPTLTDGQTITNSANIYFDYNAAIVTNTNTINVYDPLLGTDFDFVKAFCLSPVPAKNSLTITTKLDVIISSVNIYNSLGQLVQVNTDPTTTIDVSRLNKGSYFIKIASDKGTASSKFIKE